MKADDEWRASMLLFVLYCQIQGETLFFGFDEIIEIYNTATRKVFLKSLFVTPVISSAIANCTKLLQIKPPTFEIPWSSYRRIMSRNETN